MNLKNDFILQLRKDFPALEAEPLESLVSENLLSPHEILLSSDLKNKIQDIISAVFALREKKSYQDQFSVELKELGLSDPGNKSILMSYDFHLNASGQPKLIEINTNASFLLLGYEMYRAKKISNPVPDFNLEEVRTMVLKELSLQGKHPACPSVAIIDEKPEEQKLYAEFLVYNALFKSFGWQSKILDYHQALKGSSDFIYNRFTDFLLAEPDSADLKKKFISREVCLSPNPWEYFLLADKQRLVDWSSPGFLEKMDLTEEQIASIKAMLPISRELTSLTADDIWSHRKTYFLKPKRSFGSKLSYRGGSISRKLFDELVDQNMMAQEFIPAPERSFVTPEGPQDFKFDLRCYAYQDRLQMIVARLYQGQVTNLRTPGGGFACIKWA